LCQDSLEHVRNVYGGALDVMIGRNFSNAGAVSLTLTHQQDCGDHWEKAGWLRNATYNEELLLVLLKQMYRAARTQKKLALAQPAPNREAKEALRWLLAQ
jgi:hypothetical protein